jgi:uncharacterized lipoprotein YmbA
MRAGSDSVVAHRVSAALLFAALLFTGCRGLAPSSAPNTYWLLSPIEGTPADAPLRTAVGVGPLEFPNYLDRLEVVRRSGPNQLSVSEFARWGESLQKSFEDVLAQNLEILVPGTSAVRFPWKGSRQVDYRLSMVVSRFEVDIPTAAAALDASWSLTRVPRGERLGGGRVSIREPLQGKGHAAGSGAMSRGLAGLSRDIAALLEGLPAARP